MGRYWYLPNGNLLPVIPGEGRLPEVTAHGNKVIEFSSMSAYNPEENVHVQKGSWLPADYFEPLPG